MIGHADNGIHPEFSFLDCLFISGQIAVEHKELRLMLDAVVNQPIDAPGCIGEIVILLEVKIARMRKD
jgi:hypothetical protein